MNLKMKIHSFTKLVKHFVLLSLIVFTFIPCSVKGFLADRIQTSYSKPISNPKISNTLNSCLYTDLTSKQSQISQKKTITRLNSFENLSKIKFEQIESNSLSENQFEFSGNSPPKYILFKRLKIAAA